MMQPMVSACEYSTLCGVELPTKHDRSFGELWFYPGLGSLEAEKKVQY